MFEVRAVVQHHEERGVYAPSISVAEITVLDRPSIPPGAVAGELVRISALRHIAIRHHREVRWSGPTIQPGRLRELRVEVPGEEQLLVERSAKRSQTAKLER